MNAAYLGDFSSFRGISRGLSNLDRQGGHPDAGLSVLEVEILTRTFTCVRVFPDVLLMVGGRGNRSTSEGQIPNMATIRDVAARAGVAPSTVSLVLNQRPWVSADIRNAVQEAVQQLKYSQRKKGRPRINAVGQPGSRRKNQIAFLFSGEASMLHNSQNYSNILSGIQSACDKAGKVLVINTVGPGSRSLDFLLSKIDGAIFTGEMPQIMDVITKTPAVRVMGVPLDNDAWDRVTYNNHAIGRIAAEYLLGRGHRICAYFAPYVHGTGDASVDRLLPGAGLRLVCEDRGTQFAKTVCAAGATALRNEGHTDWLLGSPMALMESVKRLMFSDQRPTGLFVPTDWTACCLYPVLQSLGIRPGIDVDVIACDNDMWHLQNLSPVPATIDLATFFIGQQSVRTLMDRIEDANVPKTMVQFEPQLVLSPSEPA